MVEDVEFEHVVDYASRQGDGLRLMVFGRVGVDGDGRLLEADVGDAEARHLDGAYHAVVEHEACEEEVGVVVAEVFVDLVDNVGWDDGALLLDEPLWDWRDAVGCADGCVASLEHPSGEDAQEVEIVVARLCGGFAVDEDVVEEGLAEAAVELVCVGYGDGALGVVEAQDFDVRLVAVVGFAAVVAVGKHFVDVSLVVVDGFAEGVEVVAGGGVEPGVPSGGEEFADAAHEAFGVFASLTGGFDVVELYLFPPEFAGGWVEGVELDVGVGLCLAEHGWQVATDHSFVALEVAFQCV